MPQNGKTTCSYLHRLPEINADDTPSPTIQLPGEASVLHPHIDSVTGNRAELHVIKYVLKETKVYGGILGREETALSHCRLIFVYGPAGCRKTSIACDFAMALYGS